jgi:hypothetical protein
MCFLLPMTDQEPRTKVLSNGAVYDLDQKKIVSGAVLTSDKAREMVQARVQRKQERIMAGAAKVLEKYGDWEMPTDMDVVEAIGEAVMESAIDPMSKKQIDAARFILAESGLSMAGNPQRENAQPGEISGSPAALAELVRLLEAERSAAVDRGRAIDGTVKLHDTNQGT